MGLDIGIRLRGQIREKKQRRNKKIDGRHQGSVNFILG